MKKEKAISMLLETLPFKEQCNNVQKNLPKRQFTFNPLNAKLNPIYYLLALLAHHILHVNRIRVK
jgi:hypothetical protein